MKKLFLLFLIGIFILTGCKSTSQNYSLKRLVEQGKQNLLVQKPSNNTQNPPQTNVREASVVSPESQDVFPVSKTFTDKYSDMYVITVEKFEKNLKVTSEWQKPQEGETIIGVLVKVKNNGKHFKWAFEVEFSLKDYTGYTYSCIFPPIANHKVFEDANLAPGKECEGWIFFKVPKTVLDAPFMLIYNTGEYDENFNNKTLQFMLK
ncbi:DUF4352 domain-containing protein [Caldisericum exile]|uniref:DUF4352 domain-containing protein n=1 Tax=Caldisericum exile TaxID=693075 RepID=UPI003C745A1F